MTQDEALTHIRQRTPLDHVRGVFSSAIGQLDLAEMQRRQISPVERRVLEFELTKRIIARAVDVGLVLPIGSSDV